MELAINDMRDKLHIKKANVYKWHSWKATNIADDDNKQYQLATRKVDLDKLH